jgi:hypothetical protein
VAAGLAGSSCSGMDPAFALLAFMLLPKSRTLLSFPMRLPNWMARFSRPAAAGRPSRRSAVRSSSLSPVPATPHARRSCGQMTPE